MNHNQVGAILFLLVAAFLFLVFKAKKDKTEKDKPVEAPQPRDVREEAREAAMLKKQKEEDEVLRRERIDEYSSMDLCNTIHCLTGYEFQGLKKAPIRAWYSRQVVEIVRASEIGHAGYTVDSARHHFRQMTGFEKIYAMVLSMIYIKGTTDDRGEVATESIDPKGIADFLETQIYYDYRDDDGVKKLWVMHIIEEIAYWLFFSTHYDLTSLNSRPEKIRHWTKTSQEMQNDFFDFLEKIIKLHVRKDIKIERSEKVYKQLSSILALSAINVVSTLQSLDSIVDRESYAELIVNDAAVHDRFAYVMLIYETVEPYLIEKAGKSLLAPLSDFLPQVVIDKATWNRTLMNADGVSHNDKARPRQFRRNALNKRRQQRISRLNGLGK